MTPKLPRSQSDPPSEAELREHFASLRAAEPPVERIDHAVERARQAANRLASSSDRRASVERPTTIHSLFWKIVMPTGILAAAAVALMFVLSPASTQVASAAEVLRRAVAAQASYEGWYTLEVFDAEGQTWQMEQRVNPSAGKSLLRLAADPELYRLGLLASDWVYMDIRQPLAVSYSAEDRTAWVSGVVDPNYLQEMPLRVGDMLNWPELAGRYKARTSAESGGGVRLQLDKRPPAPDAKPTPTLRSDGGDGYPHQIVARFAAGTGLLESLALREAADDPLTKYARLRYDTPPIHDWRELIDDSVKIDDRRPSPEAAALLDRLDDLWAKGVGFDTALLVKRSGDLISGQLADVGTVTIYAEMDPAERPETSTAVSQETRAWVMLGWRGVGSQEFVDWPEVRWDGAMRLLDTREPDAALVFDGRQCWWRWGHGEEGWQTSADSTTRDFARQSRLVELFWPSREQLLQSVGRLPTRPELIRESQRKGIVTLEAVVQGQWANDPTRQLRPMLRTAVTMRENLGLMPVRREQERFDQDGGVTFRELTDYAGPGQVVMFRDPVRIPLFWRQTLQTTSDDGPPAHGNFFRLWPMRKQQLDAKWFGDPTSRWPD